MSGTTECAVQFACEGDLLQGILHPAGGAVGMVVIVGGPQYRAGSHRFFVQLARRVATAGCPVLRFDVRGMGDSAGSPRDFEALTPDIAAAIDTLLAEQPQLREVVLWGLCDGASAALLYLNERKDPRVAGLCLLNPWVRSAQTLAQARVKHYYLQRLRQPAFWHKLFRGAVGLGALSGLWRQVWAAGRSGEQHIRAASQPFPQRMLAGWQTFSKPVLLMLSANDLTAQEFSEHARRTPEWGLEAAPKQLSIHQLQQADHTCSAAHAKGSAIALVVDWMSRLSSNSGHGCLSLPDH
jgi:uncharacterized protein